MTTGIKDEELNAAIDQILTVDETAPIDPLGVPDSADTFRKVMEIVTSLLSADPWSIFYIVYLAKNHVNQDLDQALEYIRDILQALDEVGAASTPVTGLSLLEDASAALATMDTVIGSSAVLSTTALSMYTQAVDSFVDKSITPNVRAATGSGSPSTYEIVRPPAEARTAIENSLESLIELHPNLVGAVRQLQLAVTEFKDLDLAATAIRTAIRRVWITHHALKETYAEDTEYEAVGRSREAFLALTAGKTVLRDLSEARDPLSPKLASSSADTVRAVAYSPADSAFPGEVVSFMSGPYPLVSGSADQIKLAIDGGADQTITLAGATQARIRGTELPNFSISAGAKAVVASSTSGPYTIPAAPNNVFRGYVDGICYTRTLPAGSISASSLAAQLDLALDENGYAVSAHADFKEVAGTLVCEHLSAGDHRIVIGAQTVLNAAIGLADGQDSDALPSTKGQEPNNKLRLVADVGTVAEVTLPAGAGVVTTQVAFAINGAVPLLGASSVGGYLEIYSRMVGARGSVEVAPTSDVHRRAMETLGLTAAFVRGEDVPTTKVVQNVTKGLTGATVSEVSSTIAAGTEGVAQLYLGLYNLLKVEKGALGQTTVYDKITILGGKNAGSYGISSIDTATDPLADYVGVDHAFRVVDPDAEAQDQSWSVVRHRINCVSSTSGLASSVEVKPATANTLLGLTAGEARGLVSGTRVKDAKGVYTDLKTAKLEPGDVVEFTGPTYYTTHVVQRVGEYQLEVDPPTPNDLASHTFHVRAAGEVAYTSFIVALTAWQTAFDAAWGLLMEELGRVLNPLLVEASPPAGMVAGAKVAAQQLEAQYVALETVFDSFSVPASSTAKSVLSLLQERGMDRARDMLLLGAVGEALSLGWDTASYAGAVQAAVRDVARVDVPARADIEDQDDEFPGTDVPDAEADLDFPDEDDETDVLAPDDIPDEEDLEIA